MTPARACAAVAVVVVVAQLATLWGGVIACMAVGLLVAARGEESGR